jgi:hypothetical protein
MDGNWDTFEVLDQEKRERRGLERRLGSVEEGLRALEGRLLRLEAAADLSEVVAGLHEQAASK